MLDRDVKSVFPLRSNAHICEHAQFAEQNILGFQVLRGASGPKVIKDPFFSISI